MIGEYERAREEVPEGREPPVALGEVRWMLEELRLSLFAPGVRAAPGASATRIRRRLAPS